MRPKMSSIDRRLQRLASIRDRETKNAKPQKTTNYRFRFRVIEINVSSKKVVELLQCNTEEEATRFLSDVARENCFRAVIDKMEPRMCRTMTSWTSVQTEDFCRAASIARLTLL